MGKVQIIDNILVELTCPACPEQYNFYYQDVHHHDCWVRVGYLRARHGWWGLCAPGIWGEELAYGALGNAFDGNLPDSDRKEILEDCVKKIQEWLKKSSINREEPLYPQLAEIEDKNFSDAMALYEGDDNGKTNK